MKTRSLLLSLALTLSVAAPLAASAQQAPAPAGPSAAGEHMHHHGMMMHRLFQGVNLTAQQKTQIQQIITQFHQQHPQGSEPDPQAREAVHAQIMNVLTPQQQAQVKANMAKMHDHRDRDRDRDNDAPPAPAPQATP